MSVWVNSSNIPPPIRRRIFTNNEGSNGFQFAVTIEVCIVNAQPGFTAIETLGLLKSDYGYGRSTNIAVTQCARISNLSGIN